jgi:hypothetical protein
MKIVILIAMNLVSFAATAENKECTKASVDIMKLAFEMSQEFKKTNNAAAIMDKNRSELDEKSANIKKAGDKHPECLTSLKGAFSEAVAMIKPIESALKKPSNSSISYDEWFTVTKVGAEAGKKYSFIACFDGERNMTTIPKIESYTSRNLCVGGKKLFYSTDLVKDKKMQIKMTNVSAEILCVTAFIAGKELQIYSISNQSDCN